MKIYNAVNNEMIRPNKPFHVLFPDNIILSFKSKVDTGLLEYLGCTILKKKLLRENILNSVFSLETNPNNFYFNENSQEYIELLSNENVTKDFLSSLISKFFNSSPTHFNFLNTMVNEFIRKVRINSENLTSGSLFHNVKNFSNTKVFLNRKYENPNNFIRSHLVSNVKKNLINFNSFYLSKSYNFFTFKSEFFTIDYKLFEHSNCCGFAYLDLKSIKLNKNISTFISKNGQINEKILNNYFKELKYNLYNLAVSSVLFMNNKNILFVTDELENFILNIKTVGFGSRKYLIAGKLHTFLKSKKYHKDIKKIILQEKHEKVNNNLLILK